MTTSPLFGLVAAWLTLGAANFGLATATGHAGRRWLGVALLGGPLATSLFLVRARSR